MSPQQSRQVQEGATESGKTFKTHGEQINLLRSRGMVIDSDQLARHLLERVKYYRLSGYWYSWREIGADGTSYDRNGEEIRSKYSCSYCGS